MLLILFFFSCFVFRTARQASVLSVCHLGELITYWISFYYALSLYFYLGVTSWGASEVWGNVQVEDEMASPMLPSFAHNEQERTYFQTPRRATYSTQLAKDGPPHPKVGMARCASDLSGPSVGPRTTLQLFLALAEWEEKGFFLVQVTATTRKLPFRAPCFCVSHLHRYFPDSEIGAEECRVEKASILATLCCLPVRGGQKDSRKTKERERFEWLHSWKSCNYK